MRTTGIKLTKGKQKKKADGIKTRLLRPRFKVKSFLSFAPRYKDTGWDVGKRKGVAAIIGHK
jgi:hypothetical protein